ncbi:MAG: DUF3426 domain-containing protein [Pseudomonadales bacterium]|nr:DUF3426 domain-containing protein [Pseudomonadales bacterium]
MTLRVTQCPACESTFNTSPSLLETAAGRVRCGACLTVFDARENFIDTEPEPADSENESVFVSQSPEQFFNPSRFLTRQSLRDALAEQSEADLSGDSLKLTGEEIQPESSAVATDPAPEQTSAFIDAAGQSAPDNSEAGEIYIAEESDFMALVAAGVDESDEALIEPDFTDEPASPDPIAADNAAPESAPIEPEPGEAERGRDNLNAAELAGLTDPAELAESEALDEPGEPDERDAQDQEHQDEFAESPDQESPLLATAAPEPGEDLPTETEARDELSVSEALESAEESDQESEQETEKDSGQAPDELPEAESVSPASPTAPFSDSFTSSFADSFADEQRPEHLRLHARFTIETPLFATPEPLSPAGASGEAPGQTSSDEVSSEHGIADPAHSSETGNDETRDTAALEEEFNAALEEEDFQQALLDSDWQEEQPDVELPEADSAEAISTEPDGDSAETWRQTQEPGPEGEAAELPGEAAWPPEQTETANRDRDELENLADGHHQPDDTEVWQNGDFDAASSLDAEPQAQTEAVLIETDEADQSETGITAAEESDAAGSEEEKAATEFVETESTEVSGSGVESAEPGNSEIESYEIENSGIESTEIESTEAKSTEVISTEEDSSVAPESPETEASTTEDNADEAPQQEFAADPQQESPDQSLAAIRARALQAELEDDEALEAIPEENLKVLGEFSTPVEILEGRRRQLGRRLGWTLLALLAALGLASQYLWQELPRYSQQASLRPVYEWACSLSGCELPVYSQIDAIQSSNLSVRSHPQRSDALAVNVEFRNNANFPQEFPVMVLSFNSASNSVIALREFAPQEYLDEALQNRRLLPPATPIQVALEIMDPGDDAVNYTLAFRRP